MTKNGPSGSGKVYQFAVFGRPASGKTCLLAALAMPRIPHPKGYTCVRLPVDVARPAGNPATWRDDDEAAATWRGAEWLDHAIERLQQGDVPPPNPLGGPSSVFRYAFAADHRTYLIELFDYSGELIDPKNQQPESLAAALRHRMASKDGILILGEAPSPENPQQPLSTEFDLLKQAFESLKNQARNGAAAAEFPLLLLINKWDRRSYSPHDPEVERANLDRFLGLSELAASPALTESLAHLALYDAIKNAVAPDDFQVFPVSTFGECERVSTPEGRVFERPTQTDPLRSFGLEDPFIWAARRRDAIDLEAFEHDTRTARRLVPRVPLWPDRLLKRGRELTRRFAKGTEEQRRAQAASRRRSWTCRLRSLATVGVVLFCLLGIEAIHDGVNHRRVKAIVNDPTEIGSEFDWAIQWLKGYSTSPAYRHLCYRAMLSADEARETSVSVTEARERGLWAAVEKANDLMTKAQWAQEYLVRYPNGRYQTDANTIVRAARTAQERKQNAEWLSKLETDEKSVPSGPDGLRRLEGIRDAMDGKVPSNKLPFPKVEDEATGNRRTTLRDKVVNRIAVVTSQKDWETFRLVFGTAMKEGRVADGARLLANREPKDERHSLLVADFLKMAPERFNKAIDGFAEKAAWPDAYAAAAGLRDVLNQFPSPSSPGIAELLRGIRDRESALKQQHDKYLYEKVQERPVGETVRAYLDAAPLKTMAAEVRAYGDFLDKQANPQAMTLVLSTIRWGDGARSDDDNWITVDVDGKPGIEVTGVTSTANENTKDIGSCRIKKRLSDSIKLNVDIVEEGLIWNTPQGRGECTVSVREIVENAKEVRVTCDGSAQTATFTIKGVPRPPDLPRWRAN